MQGVLGGEAADAFDDLLCLTNNGHMLGVGVVASRHLAVMRDLEI